MEGAGNGDVHSLPIVSQHQETFVKETQALFALSWPIMVSTFVRYFMITVSLAFVGRLGKTPLAAASIASAFSNVAGHIILQGLGSSLETLCGQAYGAGMPLLLGVYLQRGVLLLSVCSLPLGLVWWHADKLLLFFHQDPEIAANAATFLRYFLPSLGANAFLQCLERFLQTQGVTLPMALASSAALLLHVPLTWLLVFTLRLGYVGAPIVLSFSYTLNLLLLLAYTSLSATGRRCWGGFSWDAWTGWQEFMRIALPSTVMLCLEYWGFELLTLMAGLFSDASLEVSVYSIIFTLEMLAFIFPYSIGAAISIRVSNALGASDIGRAKEAAYVGVTIAVVEVAILDLLLFLLRDYWGAAFTDAPDVIQYTAVLVPIALWAYANDSLIGTLSGIVRGSGHQERAAYVNLFAYYVVGIPLAVTLGFHFHLRAWGLYVGLATGMTTQWLCLLALVLSINWDQAVEGALSRVASAAAGSSGHLTTAYCRLADEGSAGLVERNGDSRDGSCCSAREGQPAVAGIDAPVPSTLSETLLK